MKKGIAVTLALCMALALVACGGNTNTPQDDTNKDSEAKRVEPLATTVDVSNVTDATLAASFDVGSLKTEGDAATLEVKVYNYEQYDAAEVSQLKVGDTIVSGGKDIVITSIDDSNGYVINGGYEQDGLTLAAGEGGVVYTVSVDDVKNYTEVGTVTLPISSECVLTDSSDLENGEKTVNAADLAAFLENDTVGFQPASTQVTVTGGQITAIARVYIP